MISEEYYKMLKVTLSDLYKSKRKVKNYEDASYWNKEIEEVTKLIKKYEKGNMDNNCSSHNIVGNDDKDIL